MKSSEFKRASPLAEYCDLVLDLKNAHYGDEHFYQSLPLCVIDAVYSIGVIYEGTRRTVKRYCDYYSLQRIRSDRATVPQSEEQESIGQFIEKIISAGIEFFTKKVFQNRQRTSTRNGILKSEAVLRFAKTLQKYRVNYFQDISRVIDDVKFEDDIKTIPGQRSGISLKYFFMLAGSEDLIKPDRWIKQFIENPIKKQVSDQESQWLLSEACEELRLKHPRLTPRLLDHEIWKYQRSKSKKGKRGNKHLNQKEDFKKFVGARNNPSVPLVGSHTGKIAGRIVRPDTDRLEITISKNQDHRLPLKPGRRVPINLSIGGESYEAGVRITKQGVPWICPDLRDSRGQKVRLADALRRSGFEKGDKVFIVKSKSQNFKTFHLEHGTEGSEMSWWKIVSEKVSEGDILFTPGRGMKGLNKKPFKITEKGADIIRILSGNSLIPLERKCFDTIEEAFKESSSLQLRVAALKDNKPLEGSADKLIRNATGSQLARGNYVCSILEYCGLVQYKMKGRKKVIVLPGKP